MIKVENLSKFFENKRVLDKVNFSVNKGETFLIIGRSGAGKTVLLKTIIGLLKADKGRVIVDNVDITNLDKKGLDKIRLKFGVVFQGSALFDSLTIEENVGFALYQHSNLSSLQIRQKVKETLHLVGLENIEHLYPYELSGGMRKRVAIARAVIYKPQILIYDEPTTGIDPISVDKIVSLIEDLHKRFFVTSLVVTHDLNIGLKLADRLAFLLGGRIIFEGNKDDLNNVNDERVIQFLKGSSAGPIKEMEV
ncbi:MAG: ABC transporter ATP-binding protein [Candidatus Omnitrophica bacterium 4484_70.1]|nr:MAG: ABC transporter ATP-binding protein [Candidatus Omnitrophica bacterium 4484_70.1]